MGLRVPNTFLGVLGANTHRGKAQEDRSARATPSQRGFAWLLRAVGLSLLVGFFSRASQGFMGWWGVSAYRTLGDSSS